MPVQETKLASNTVLITDGTARDIIPAASVGTNQRAVSLSYTAVNVTAAQAPIILLETLETVPQLVDQCAPGDPAAALKEPGIVRVPADPPIALPAGAGLSGKAASAVGLVTVTVRYQLQTV